MEHLETFKEQYAKAAQKYSLPLFEDLDQDLFITDTINTKKFVPQQTLGFVRGILAELFSGWINYLHGFIMPNTQSAILMQEYEKLSDDDKKQIIEIIQDMMIMQRESTLLSLEKNDQKNAEFIKKYFEFWITTKKELISVSQKSLDNWKKREPEKVKETLGL